MQRITRRRAFGVMVAGAVLPAIGSHAAALAANAAEEGPSPAELIRTMEGFRKAIPEAQGLAEQNGMSVKATEPYLLTHLGGVARRLGVKTRGQCLVLMTYLKDPDGRLRWIAPDLFRLSVYVPELDMQFNHFLVRDDEPLLFHTGSRGMFPILHEAVGKLIDPASLRHIAWSHFETDECGALNEWLKIAPQAQAVCTLIAKIVNVDDFSNRPVRAMSRDDVLCTGKYRYRFYPSPHIPHGWDAGVLFEETRRTLFCSDLFHHFGDVAPMTTSDLIDPTRRAMQILQQGPLVGYMPYTCHTEGVLRSLAELRPDTLAVMHGSSFTGACDRLLVDLAGCIRENFHVPESRVPPDA